MTAVAGAPPPPAPAHGNRLCLAFAAAVLAALLASGTLLLRRSGEEARWPPPHSRPHTQLDRTGTSAQANASNSSDPSPAPVPPAWDEGFSYAWWLTFGGFRWLTRRSEWVHPAPACAHARRAGRRAVFRLPSVCASGAVRILRWHLPKYGEDSLWAAGAAEGSFRRVEPPFLRPWADSAMAYLGIRGAPNGTAPNNTFFFRPTRGWAGRACPGAAGLFDSPASGNNADLLEADVVLVDYPYVLGGPKQVGMRPPAASIGGSQATVLYFSGESAAHYPYVVEPAFQSLFNATIGAPRGHFDFPAAPSYASPPALIQAMGREPSSQARVIEREGAWPADAPLIAFMISNCEAPTFRMEYARELVAILGRGRVHSYGGCDHTHDIDPAILTANGVPLEPGYHFRGDWRGVKRGVFSRYPFVLAFENANCYDSVTEKVFDGLMSGAVPIYMGAPNVADYMPPRSYIDARWFASPAELAHYVRGVAANSTLYSAYHAWRGGNASDWPWIADAHEGETPCTVLARRWEEDCGGVSGRRGGAFRGDRGESKAPN